jgi:hypothetical protein
LIVLYTSYLYARSFLERAFLEIGPFAHVTEHEMAQAFDDVESGTVLPFQYQFPLRLLQMHKEDEQIERSYKWDWECRQAYGSGSLVCQVEMGFAAEPMARLIQNRHGILCHICMNPTASIHCLGDYGFCNKLQIGRQSYGFDFPNVCRECVPLAKLNSAIGGDLKFINEIRKALRNKESGFYKRLMGAPALRFEPRREHAA